MRSLLFLAFILFALSGCKSDGESITLTELSIFELEAEGVNCDDSLIASTLNGAYSELYAAIDHISVLPGSDSGQLGWTFKSYISKDKKFIFEQYDIIAHGEAPVLSRTVTGEIKGSSIYFDLGCDELVVYVYTGREADPEQAE